ncbi:MAG: GNAT family N-acetyltransferase, partial [Bacillota bacterium]
LIPCVYPPPQPPCGTAEGLEEAAGLRRTWLRNGLASDRLRVMLALARAPSEPFIDYPGVGPIPTEALARGGHIPAGLVEYAPGDYAAEPVEAQGAWVIHCVWVIPPYAGRGIARRLVAEILRDVWEDRGALDPPTDRPPVWR